MNNQDAKQQVGVWIDHKDAFIVAHRNKADSDAADESTDKHVRFAGHASEGQSPAEDQRNRRLANQLDHYYDEVIEQLAGISSIFIFGPGEAKGEFKKRLEHKGMGELVAGCEPAERMTAHQITAKVQTFFHA